MATKTGKVRIIGHAIDAPYLLDVTCIIDDKPLCASSSKSTWRKKKQRFGKGKPMFGRTRRK